MICKFQEIRASLEKGYRKAMENFISDAEFFRVNKVLQNFQRHKSKEVLGDGGILGDFPRASYHYGSWDFQR